MYAAINGSIFCGIDVNSSKGRDKSMFKNGII